MSHQSQQQAPASPDAQTKKGFTLHAMRPFFRRRGGSSSNLSASSKLSSSLSSTTTDQGAGGPDRLSASPFASTSTAFVERDSPADSASTVQDSSGHNTVTWKDHAVTNTQKRTSQDSDSSGNKSAAREQTPMCGSGRSNYFATVLGTPTPTVGVSSSISESELVKGLNSLLLEPASLALAQLAPPSVLAIPWFASPYGKDHPDAPSSTSLSTYLSQSSSDHLHSLHHREPCHRAYGCNEQLAASALSIPSVSIAALWRSLMCMRWINENAAPFCHAISSGEAASYLQAKARDDTTDEDSFDSFWAPPNLAIFEVGGLLQNLMDVLSSAAATLGIELVLYHGQDPTYEQPQPGEFRPESGLRELHCKGDDAGLGAAIIAIVYKVMQQSRAGDTIEIGLSLACKALQSDMRDIEESTLFSQRPESIHSSIEDEDEEEGTPWEATLDISHSCAASASGLAESTDPFVHDELVNALAKGMNITLGKARRVSPSRRGWPIGIKLRQTVPPPPGPDPLLSSSASQHKHKGISPEMVKEPSPTDLLRFAETFLRGKKAVIHSSEDSLFAKHLTGYLAMWGLLPSHVALEHHLHDEDQVSSRPVHSASRMYDHASVDGDSNPGHHRAHPANQDVHSPPPHIPLLDPSVNFIFIDDDISTLRRQLIVIKNSAPQLQLPATLLNKRPGLQNRRARSSAHIKPTSTNTQLTVIYFASLSKFRYIRELVQSIFRSANQTFPLPEVFVLPKPVGPRRLLTALHTAIKRPFIDASVLPIATSPSSPGGQFLFSSSSRPSPAPSSHQEFDAAFGAHAHAMEQSNGSSSHGPLTPPYNVAPLAPSDPPSPRTSSTEAVEYLEYMSKTSTNLGKDVSSGIVIQSHDGKAQGLFFNPKRGANVNTTSSLPRASRDLEQADQEDRRKTSESTERASDEDNQPLQSPSTDVEPAFVAGTPLSAHVPLTGIMDASPVIPEKSAYVQQQPMQDAEKASTDADHDSPPTLPAVGPALVSLSSQAGSTSSCSMSPPLEAGDRALPLEAFTTSVGGPPPASRSLSDPIVVPSSSVVSEAKVQMPSLNRTITAPSTTNPLMGQHTSSEHAQTSPLHHKTPARDQSPTSAAPEAARERQSPTTQQQQEHVSNIAGPPAAILARSAGRKPRNDYFKSKRKPPTAAVPPVNVLIVEDNRIEQVVVSTFLRKRGIRCSVAANGQEAVDKWRTGGFHLVLMDIQLPVKSGIEATMEIRELEKANNIAAFQMTPTAEGPPPSARSQSSTSSQSSAVEDSKLGNELKLTAIPSPVTTPAHQLPVIIVALTASSLSADRISALAAGCNDFITKPVNHKWLHQKVLEWGSMSYLSSFRRLKTPSTAPVSPVTRTGLTFDRVAAQHKAQEIAAGLYIERKPKEVNSNREDPPPGASASV